MKHTNKKGFTIVELVIVIAVIAILAAVLIPNLSRLVTKADKSAAMQEAKAAMDDDLINAEGDLENMEKYQKKDSASKVVEQYYVIQEVESSTTSVAPENKLIIVGTDGVVVDTAATGTTYKYYEAHAFNGIYTKATGTYTVEKAGYICSFANGEWKIVEK